MTEPVRISRLEPRPSLRIHLALIAVQLFFASFSTVGKIALRELRPMELASLRVTATALVFLVLWLAFGRERVSLADLGRTAVYAFFGVVANQLLFLTGLARTTATEAVVIGASIPVFTVGIALLLRREQATPLKFVGLLLSLAGALIVTGAARLPGGHALGGNALIVLNSLCYAIYLVIGRDILTRKKPLTVVMLTFVFGAIGIDLILAAVSVVSPTATSSLAIYGRLPALSSRTLLSLGYIVLLPTVGTYLLNAFALRAAPASLVAVYIYAQPIVGTIIASAILDERPALRTAIAALLIFAGIWLVGFDSRRARRLDRASEDPPKHHHDHDHDHDQAT